MVLRVSVSGRDICKSTSSIYLRYFAVEGSLAPLGEEWGKIKRYFFVYPGGLQQRSLPVSDELRSRVSTERNMKFDRHS